jgi:hypothetical protein
MQEVCGMLPTSRHPRPHEAGGRAGQCWRASERAKEPASGVTAAGRARPVADERRGAKDQQQGTRAPGLAHLPRAGGAPPPDPGQEGGGQQE